MADLRPPLDPIFAAFSVPAIITPVNDAPITAEWVRVDIMTPANLRIRTAFLIGAGEVGEQRPIFAIRRDQVSTLPVNSRVEAADIDGAPVNLWNIDSVNDLDPEVFTVEAHILETA
jgi:hypothetical protein